MVSAISNFDLIVNLQERGGGIYIVFFFFCNTCLYSAITGFTTSKSFDAFKRRCTHHFGIAIVANVGFSTKQ